MNASSSRSRTRPPAEVEPRSRFLQRGSCSSVPCRRASCELEPRPLAPHWTRALASSVGTLLAEPVPAVGHLARLLQAEAALPAAGQGLGQELASSTQPPAAVRAAAVAEVLEGRVAGPPSPLGQTRASPRSGPCKRIPRARSTNAAEHPQYPRLPMMHAPVSAHKTFFEFRRPIFAHRLV